MALLLQPSACADYSLHMFCFPLTTTLRTYINTALGMHMRLTNLPVYLRFGTAVLHVHA